MQKRLVLQNLLFSFGFSVAVPGLFASRFVLPLVHLLHLFKESHLLISQLAQLLAEELLHLRELVGKHLFNYLLNIWHFLNTLLGSLFQLLLPVALSFFNFLALVIVVNLLWL